MQIIGSSFLSRTNYPANTQKRETNYQKLNLTQQKSSLAFGIKVESSRIFWTVAEKNDEVNNLLIRLLKNTKDPRTIFFDIKERQSGNRLVDQEIKLEIKSSRFEKLLKNSLLKSIIPTEQKSITDEFFYKRHYTDGIPLSEIKQNELMSELKRSINSLKKSDTFLKKRMKGFLSIVRDLKKKEIDITAKDIPTNFWNDYCADPSKGTALKKYFGLTKEGIPKKELPTSLWNDYKNDPNALDKFKVFYNLTKKYPSKLVIGMGWDTYKKFSGISSSLERFASTENKNKLTVSNYYDNNGGYYIKLKMENPDYNALFSEEERKSDKYITGLTQMVKYHDDYSRDNIDPNTVANNVNNKISELETLIKNKIKKRNFFLSIIPEEVSATK